MTMNISIKTNAIEAKHFYNTLARSQLPFAISKAINRLAWDIRDDEQKSLDKYFELRTNWLTKRGAMPVIPSKKKQYPDIHAIIGVKDEVAAMAVTGGEKKSASSSMAVPLSNAGGNVSARSILNPGRETLPKSKWPSKIVKDANKTQRRRRGGAGFRKPKAFYLQTKTGRTFVALRTTASSFPIKFLYEFKDSVTIPKSWPLVANASRYVGSKYDDFLQQEIDKAVRTIRL